MQLKVCYIKAGINIFKCGCLYLKGGSGQPPLHHHVHQRVSAAALSCAGCNQEVHQGHGPARQPHRTQG